MIAVHSPHDLIVLHALGASKTPAIAGAHVQGFDTIAGMLAAFRNWLEQRCDTSTPIVGHNLKFDLAKLRSAYVRNGIQIPPAFVLRDQLTCCTMETYCRRFSTSSAKMISLADACESLGIEHHKDVVTGADVGSLIEAGEVETLCRYSALDVLLEGRLFAVMTGQASEELR